MILRLHTVLGSFGEENSRAFFSDKESLEEADGFLGAPSPDPVIPPPGAQLGSESKEGGGAGGRDHPASSLGLALHGPRMLLGDGAGEEGTICASLGRLYPRESSR